MPTFFSAIMLTKESRAAFAAHPSKSGVKPRYHREHFFQHIAIYPFVRFDVLRLALECLFAERLAVETHIVEVCPSVIDDVKAVGTCLVPRKAHAQAVAHVYEVLASSHGGKASAAYLLQNYLCYHIRCLLGFICWRCVHRQRA